MNIVVHTITGVEASIHICNYLLGSKHETLQEELERIDVVNKLQYAQALLYRLNHTCKKNNACMEDPCHPVVVAASGLIDSVQTIRNDLNKLQQECANHKRAWFKGWYTPNYNTTLERLRTHVTIHDLRANRLIHVLPLLQQDYDNDNDNKEYDKNMDTLTSTNSTDVVAQENGEHEKYDKAIQRTYSRALRRSNTWS